MPELPEVETIRRQLAETIVGATITGITVRRANSYVGPELLDCELVNEIARAGKYLFVQFGSGG